MNELLQRHGCANVFKIPEGLKELMADITREVLRAQPPRLYEFISNYLSALLITREHGVLAVKILEDLCDCRPTVSEHLLQIGFQDGQAADISTIVKAEIDALDDKGAPDKFNELNILKLVMQKYPLNETEAAAVCQVIRNAYKDYFYKKAMLKKTLVVEEDQPWEIAVQKTLAIYKKTKPSLTELNRASERIQAAYKGYYVRKNMLQLKPKKPGPKDFDSAGAPIDIAGSREIDLGPVITLKIDTAEKREPSTQLANFALRTPFSSKADNRDQVEKPLDELEIFQKIMDKQKPPTPPPEEVVEPPEPKSAPESVVESAPPSIPDTTVDGTHVTDDFELEDAETDIPMSEYYDEDHLTDIPEDMNEDAQDDIADIGDIGDIDTDKDDKAGDTDVSAAEDGDK